MKKIHMSYTQQRPRTTKSFVKIKKKLNTSQSTNIENSFSSGIITTTTNVQTESNLYTEHKSHSRKFKSFNQLKNSQQFNGYSFYKGGNTNKENQPYLGQYNIYNVIMRGEATPIKKSLTSQTNYFSKNTTPRSKSTQRLIFINKKNLVFPLSNYNRQIFNTPISTNKKIKIKLKAETSGLKIKKEKKHLRFNSTEIDLKKKKEHPFTIKHVEVLNNPDSKVYPLFQFAKTLQKTQKEFYDKTLKEKVKILAKEINQKEAGIRKRLLDLKRTRRLNDEFLARKFLTSEKTFFDRKVKYE